MSQQESPVVEFLSKYQPTIDLAGLLLYTVLTYRAAKSRHSKRLVWHAWSAGMLCERVLTRLNDAVNQLAEDIKKETARVHYPHYD